MFKLFKFFLHLYLLFYFLAFAFVAAYCQVYGVIHFTSPAGPTLGNEYGKTLPFYPLSYVDSGLYSRWQIPP